MPYRCSPRFKTGVRLHSLSLIALCCASGGSASGLGVDHIEVQTRSVIASFKPTEAFGVAIDGGDKDESRPLFMPSNRHAMLALDASRVSYRLRTELGIEAWHWSSHGRWSDQAHSQGYWTGDPTVIDKSDVSFGYRLPRRGNTFDEANNDGYSRIDDGDPLSFWKSNPYLDAPLHWSGRRASGLDRGRAS